MKKRILLSIMVGVILVMTGCNFQELSQSGMSQNGQQGQMAESDESMTGAEHQSEAESVTGAEPPQYLDVSLDNHYDSNCGELLFMNARYHSLNLRTIEYPALTRAVNAFNAEYIARTQGYIDQIEQDALDMYEAVAEQFTGPFVYESEMFLKRADDEVLSMEEFIYSYEGGAHGVAFYDAHNIDVQTGEEIVLEDVIMDMNGLPDILAAKILAKYPEITYWAGTLEEVFGEYIAPASTEFKPEFTWTLGYDGVTFYFSTYEIGSYADGVQQVTVLYSEYPEIFNKNYFVNIDPNYVVMADRNCGGIDTDLNDDGITDYIMVTRNYNADTDYSESYNVTVNGNTFIQDTYCYDLDTFLVKSKDDNYLYVQRTVENDYQSVCVFQITENSVEYIGEFSGGMYSFTNSLDFDMTKRMDLLSTYTAIASCSMGPDGLPIESSGVYEVQNDISITSTVEITAELLDEEGNLTGSSYTFPVGTSFTFQRSDGTTYVDVLADDGQECRFYTSPEWPPTVNGMDAEESFEELWYAG